MKDKLVESLQTLPNFAQGIVYSGVILLNGHSSVVSQAKKDEFIKDVQLLINELNSVKDAVINLEIKQD